MYGEYDHLCGQVIGAEIVRAELSEAEAFAPDPDEIAKAARGCRLLIMVNPNSPTGRTLSAEGLGRLLSQLDDDITVWIDETYIDFAPGVPSAEPLVATDPRLIVCKSMSKFFGLSGLRVGYLAADPARLVGLTQVHGIDVATVEQPWLPGQGPRADAAVTDRPGIAIGIVTADCAPVLFADAEAGVVGGAHAGWRGAVAGVLEATLAAMEALGAKRERIAAAVGPCIGQDSYEVAADLREAVLAHNPADARFFAEGRRPERWQFDLASYCANRLRDAGTGTVAALGLDTLALEEKFFSPRRRTLLSIQQMKDIAALQAASSLSASGIPGTSSVLLS
jgi:YfiH family protein